MGIPIGEKSKAITANIMPAAICFVIKNDTTDKINAKPAIIIVMKNAGYDNNRNANSRMTSIIQSGTAKFLSPARIATDGLPLAACS
jgi:hypothetical protein